MNDIVDIYDPTVEVETTLNPSTERLLTFEEYLDAEEQGNERHEFHNGKLTIMPGGTDIHAELAANIITAINNALFVKEDETTHVYSADMKIQIITHGRTVYPDACAVEGEPIYYLGSRRVIVNPLVVVEVLSESTEKYDRNLKFDRYKTLDAFREYILVSQKEPKVEVFFLQNPAENVWQTTTYEGLDKEVELQSIGCSLKMKQIYHRVFKAEITTTEK